MMLYLLLLQKNFQLSWPSWPLIERSMLLCDRTQLTVPFFPEYDINKLRIDLIRVQNEENGKTTLRCRRRSEPARTALIPFPPHLFRMVAQTDMPPPALASLPPHLFARVLDWLEPASLLAVAASCRAFRNPATDALKSGISHANTRVTVELLFSTVLGDRRIAYVLEPRVLKWPRIAFDVDIPGSRSLLDASIMKLKLDTSEGGKKTLAVALAERESLAFQAPESWSGGPVKVLVTWIWKGVPGNVLESFVDLGSGERLEPSRRGSFAGSLARPASPSIKRASSPAPFGSAPSPRPDSASTNSLSLSPSFNSVSYSWTVAGVQASRAQSVPTLPYPTADNDVLSPELSLLSIAQPEPQHSSPHGSPTERETSWSSVPRIQISPLPPVRPGSEPYTTQVTQTESPKGHKKRSSWTLPFSPSRRAQEREREKERLQRLEALSQSQKLARQLNLPGIDWNGDGIPDVAPGTARVIPPTPLEPAQERIGLFGRILGRSRSPSPSRAAAAAPAAERDSGRESMVKTAVVLLSSGSGNDYEPSFLKITYETAGSSQSTWSLFSSEEETKGMEISRVQGTVSVGVWSSLF